VRLASIHADLVFHLLAFVPPPRTSSALARAASLYCPKYIEFAKGALPAGAVEPCERDASILSALAARDDIATGLQLLAVLHDDIGAALAGALKGVRELGPEDVSSPWAQRALAALPEDPVEIARVAIALAGPDFEEAHDRVFGDAARRLLEAIAPKWTELEARIGALSTTDVRLSSTLGAHGRGFGKTVIVGAHGLPGDEPDPLGPLVFAVHEIAVQAAGRALEACGIDPTWARAERIALVAAEAVLRGSSIADRWAAWRASLGTDALIAEADIPQGVVESTSLALVGPSA
jgi:hypothetical protein